MSLSPAFQMASARFASAGPYWHYKKFNQKFFDEKKIPKMLAGISIKAINIQREAQILHEEF